jgi:hypothetical protein
MYVFMGREKPAPTHQVATWESTDAGHRAAAKEAAGGGRLKP